MTTGTNYTPGMSLKEITASVRQYAKKNHSGYRFSVTISRAGLSEELHITLTEGPRAAYKEFAELTEEERREIRSKYMRDNNIGSAWPDELDAEISAGAFNDKHRPKYMARLADGVREAVEGVTQYANSFNMDDSDAMRDHFDTNFYFFGVDIGKWDKPYKITPSETEAA